MMVHVRDPDDDDQLFYREVAKIALNLRPQDRQEVIDALGVEDTADGVVHGVLGTLRSHLDNDSHCFLFYDGPDPAAVMIVSPTTPTCGVANLIATPAFRRVVLDVTRFTRNWLLPTLIQKGVRRLECRVSAANDKAWRWLETFGAVREAKIVGYAPELYYQYAWLPELTEADATKGSH